MIVRKASRRDLLGVGRVAEAAFWESYEDLLPPDTIGRLLARDFSPSAVARRLLRGSLMVAGTTEEVVGFGDGRVDDDRVLVTGLATLPGWRRRGVGTALLAAVRESAGPVPAATDLLLGHFEAEQFMEVNGFVPGEIRHASLFGLEVVERRWWADVSSGAGFGRRAATGH